MMRKLQVSLACSLVVIVFLVASTFYFREVSVWQENWNERLSGDKDALAREIEGLEEYVDGIELNNSLLQNENEGLQEENVDLQDVNELLQGQVDELETEKTQLEADISELSQSNILLNDRIDSLEDAKTALENNYNALNQSYILLSQTYETLEQNYTELQTEISDLENRYVSLQGNYNSLQTNYATLNESYTLLNQIYESLEQDYIILNEAYDSYISAYEELRDEINLRVFHPTEDEKTLITPDDPDVQSLMLSVTGGWSNHNDFNEYWNDVKALYDWVVTNIEYRYDGFYPILPYSPYGDVWYFEEMWQLPSETINEKKGDCEDQAILLTSLIYAYNEKQYATYCIVTWNHMAVCFPVVGDKICILDPAMGYYTNTGWPYYEISSKDIRQEVTHWISSFNLIEVEWVFSLTIWEIFTSTDAFINWMY